MRALKILKQNLFAALVAAAYIALFIVRADMGAASLKNSAYILFSRDRSRYYVPTSLF